MLDFRRNSVLRAAEGRQEQRRLLAMVLLLGLVVVLIGWVSDPAVWRWLNLLLAPPEGHQDGDWIDNRVEAVARQEAAADSFVAERHPKEPGPAPAPLTSAEGFAAIRDDTPSTREDRVCSLRLLDILRRTDCRTLGRLSLGPVSYAQLFRQPNQYRGRLVDVSGVVRRAVCLELGPNPQGIERYYQVWLWPSDNPTAPVVVYCLYLPRGFPTGMELAEEASVTGFFLKRWVYQATDSLRTAPELLARTLQWAPRPVLTPSQPGATWLILLLAGLAGVVALGAAGVVYWRTRAGRPALPDRLPHFELPGDSRTTSCDNSRELTVCRAWAASFLSPEAEHVSSSYI